MLQKGRVHKVSLQYIGIPERLMWKVSRNTDRMQDTATYCITVPKKVDQKQYVPELLAGQS